MKHWYLITTKLKSEFRVKQNLMVDHGIEVFYPVLPAKKVSSPTGMPLFPRYAFAHFDLYKAFDKVRYTPGVSRVISFGAEPTPVEPQVIQCLRERCDDRDIVQKQAFKEGQQVTVVKGIFEGCKAIVTEKRGSNRVQMLLDLAFGGNLKLEAPVSHLETLQH